MNPEKFGGFYDGGESNDPPAFIIPEVYSNEGWAKDIKSDADVWSKLAGSEKLIGQRVEGKIDLLKENSTSEEINTYYKALGRPDEAKGYEFNREGQSEEFKKLNSDEIDNAFKEIFHKHGLSGKQATGVQKDCETMMETRLVEQLEKEKKIDSEFDGMAIKTFGHDKEAIIESSKILLEKFAPEGFGDKIQKLDNETLVVVAGVLNNLKKTYISEDAMKELTGSEKRTEGETEEALRTEARKLMASPEWTDSMNPRNKEVKDEVEAIYKKIGSM